MTVNVALVGCGRVAGRGHIPAAALIPSVELVAVCDRDPDRAAAAAGLIGGAASFTDPAEMLAAERIDGLVVAAPTGAHVELAMLAAEAGVPSLVEKPPAPDLAGAEALAELEPEPSLGFNRRLLQGVRLMPSIPEDGWLELDLELRFRRAGWGAHESHDEALLDAGIHMIDLALFLAGAAPIAVRDAEIGPERASVELELSRGRARIRCAVDRAYTERVEVRDRAGRTVAAARIGRIGGAVGRLRGREEPLVGSLRRQLELFAARIRGDDSGPLARAGAGVAAMAVVEAARRSFELGGSEVTVEVAAPRSVGTPG